MAEIPITALEGEWSAATDFYVPVQRRYDRSGNFPVDDKRGLFVLHSVMLCTGKVLVFCGHVESLFYGGEAEVGAATSDYRGVSFVFDPENPPTVDEPMTPIYWEAGVDFFCCHYVQLHDGRILVVGGSVDFHMHSSFGAKNIAIFDPITETWEYNKNNSLEQGRWYPTAVMLGSGKVVVFSGRDERDAPIPAGSTSRAPIADKVEILAPPRYCAQEVSGGTFTLPIYPGMHLAPNGKIFFTGTNWGQEIDNPSTRAITIDSVTNTGTWDDFGGSLTPNQPRREEGMSVLLPPAREGKILVFGGSLALDSADNPILQRSSTGIFNKIHSSTDPFSAEILDTMADPPSWTDTASPMAHGRINGHGVILPDATVLIAGGHDFYKWNDTSDGTTPSLVCEIFDGTDFTEVASLNHPRMYHSIMVLLPDGRVLAAGGADPNDQEPALHQNPDGSPRRFVPPMIVSGFERPYPRDWNAPIYGGFRADGTYVSIALNRKDYEFYKPPYFFKGERPVIDEVYRNGVSSRQTYYGERFTIASPQASDITKVAFIRPGAPTHHTDSEQRYIDLTFEIDESGDLLVDTPVDHFIAPPGYYMLWIMREAEAPFSGLVPCDKAEFVQLADLMPYSYPDCPPKDSCICIIATTTFGTDQHRYVKYLRNLRDQLHRSSVLGKNFVWFATKSYYSFSPKIAEILSTDVKAKGKTRKFIIQPLVKVIQGTEAFIRKHVGKRFQPYLLIACLILEFPIWIFLLAGLFGLTLESVLTQKFFNSGKQ